VTDYGNFGRMFPMLREVRAGVEPDGRSRLQCKVTSIFGTWPVDVRIRHDTSGREARRLLGRAHREHHRQPRKLDAHHDGPRKDSGDLPSRGRGAALPPTPLVRAVLLSRQKTVVEALASHLEKKP
jgi:hypothetical protein